jgi:transcriptional regulator with XRE-family HTH domain
MSQALAVFVARKRQERYLNVRQAADAWGLSPSTIARLEAAPDQEPRLATLAQLARALRVPLWYVLDLQGLDPGLPTQFDPDTARWDTTVRQMEQAAVH